MLRMTLSDLADLTAALAVLEALKRPWPWVEHLFSDVIYDRRSLLDKATFLDFAIEVVRRLEKQ